MPVVPQGANHSAQMEALIEQRIGLPLSAFISFFLANENLNLFCQKSAYR